MKTNGCKLDFFSPGAENMQRINPLTEMSKNQISLRQTVLAN
jgi:hypothetical protein